MFALLWGDPVEASREYHISYSWGVHKWVLETKLQSPGRAASTFTHCTISPAPSLLADAMNLPVFGPQVIESYHTCLSVTDWLISVTAPSIWIVLVGGYSRLPFLLKG